MEQKAESALDNIKDKLMSALPSVSQHHSGSSASGPSTNGTVVGGGIEIGIMGIIHPTVLENFDLEYPCSVLEFKLEGL